MKRLSGDKIKQVEDFKYLGSYIASTEHDVHSRLGKVWNALDQLYKIWKSNLPDNLKRNFFREGVETVLLWFSLLDLNNIWKRKSTEHTLECYALP